MAKRDLVLSEGQLCDSDGNKLNLATLLGVSAVDFTQTYSTANATVAAPTAVTLVDNTAGTANTTLQALSDGSTYANDVAAIRNNFADLAAAVNALIADDLDNRQSINAIIDLLEGIDTAS